MPTLQTHIFPFLFGPYDIENVAQSFSVGWVLYDDSLLCTLQENFRFNKRLSLAKRIFLKYGILSLIAT